MNEPKFKIGQEVSFCEEKSETIMNGKIIGFSKYSAYEYKYIITCKNKDAFMDEHFNDIGEWRILPLITDENFLEEIKRLYKILLDIYYYPGMEL